MSHNKVAILIDGGFFVQRYKYINNTDGHPSQKDVELLIGEIMEKVRQQTAESSKDVLLRSFYYDCEPYSKSMKTPKGNCIDFGKKRGYARNMSFLKSLKNIDQFALRLGHLSFGGWQVDINKPNKEPIPKLTQKGVDMKIGLDIAWMAGRKTIDKIVLVTGDSDFIAPIKLARREGILVYLFTLGAKNIKSELKEHADFII